MFAKYYKKYRYSLILLRELVATDFKVRYQNSVLGYLWSLLRPLFMFIVLYIIFVKFLHIGDKIPHWPVALFLGLVMWEFFNEVTKQGLKSIVGKGALIRKINFPKYIIVVANSLSALINLALNMIVVVIFIVITHTPVGWGSLWVPVYIFELYILALGLSFILSTMYVKVRDINFIWEIVLRAGFYVSAIMFPMEKVFEFSQTAGKLLLLNPVAQSVNDARTGMLGGDIIPSTATSLGSDLLLFVPLGIVIASLVFGAWYFRRRSRYFAEEI